MTARVHVGGHVRSGRHRTRGAGAVSAAERGSVLIESLAALALLGAAGAVIAAAAMTSLRAIRQASQCQRITAVAARELALLQAGGAEEQTIDRWADDPGAVSPEHLSAFVHRRTDGIAELSVTIDADHGGAAATSVTVATHVVLADAFAE